MRYSDEEIAKAVVEENDEIIAQYAMKEAELFLTKHIENVPETGFTDLCMDAVVMALKYYKMDKIKEMSNPSLGVRNIVWHILAESVNGLNSRGTSEEYDEFNEDHYNI